ncbi:hypothetical protein K7A41_00530 [Sphingobacterium sp. InxBP1]|uniref:hypothetical protein n=1 Tax=Sphingobacterium sp. InxBP1 TaxID=2870328 RepID=UPI0022440C97|nr:hypothetical protein [Sphingobacterium sp. InxBP1]MCW8309706.1 hypothetical protein [Sphingobacterium sp. InxBP1]
MKKIKIERFIILFILIWMLLSNCANTGVKSIGYPSNKIKVLFDKGLIHDDKFDYKKFMSNITNPSYDVVNYLNSIRLDSTKWHVLHGKLMIEMNKEGDEALNKSGWYDYGDCKIYILIENIGMILINNTNDIFSFRDNKVIKHKNHEFANNIRDIINYYDYFDKKNCN